MVYSIPATKYSEFCPVPALYFLQNSKAVFKNCCTNNITNIGSLLAVY